MQTLLPEDQVLCGLVRMGFGTGKFRRTKWVSIWWVGSKVSAVKKGQMLGSGKDQVMRKINSGGITLEGATVDDVSVDEVRRTTIPPAIVLPRELIFRADPGWVLHRYPAVLLPWQYMGRGTATAATVRSVR